MPKYTQTNMPRLLTPLQAMTDDEVGSGLVLPFVAQAVAGKAGAGAFLVTIFMVSFTPNQLQP